MSITKQEQPLAGTPLAGAGAPASKGQSRALTPWVLLALPLGYLWFHLIDNVRLEWSTNPQYSYGLVVPLLVIGLLFRRWLPLRGSSVNPKTTQPWAAVLLCGMLAFLYLPTRLIEAATPEWRPLQWALAIETVGLTLYALYLMGGRTWLRQFAFPVMFFLVAIPWPTPVEQPIIQDLSRLNSAGVVDVLFFLNIPAIQHGNVIEVSTGTVGINDACSGIRSLQSSLMMSLFLGEFYWFGWRRRLLLVPLGIGLAMLLNLCRTTLLTWLAATRGINAIAEYHDEAGMTILLVCSALLWGMALLLSRRKGSKQPDAIRVNGAAPATTSANGILPRRIGTFGVALIVWLLVVESGVELWYRIRESHLKPGPNWSVKLPTQNPTFQVLPFTHAEHELLQFDQGAQGEWKEADGTSWEVFYYNWVPGRVAGYLAKRHTPDICMTAAGFQMLSGPELMVMNINNVELPMRHYVFSSSDGPLQVFQCHWQAGMGKDTYTADESSRFNLVRGIWAGRGNHGQKVLEVIISGSENVEAARKALERQLGNIIHVEAQ